jgi:hypothetical protein
LCGREPAPKRLGLDVVRGNALAVDLHDRQPFAVASLELRVAVDRHLAKLEAELVAQLVQLLLRALAEVTAGRLVQNDPRVTDTGPA